MLRPPRRAAETRFGKRWKSIPALTGIDLLYSEGIVADMLENQKEKYPRFFRE